MLVQRRGEMQSASELQLIVGPTRAAQMSCQPQLPLMHCESALHGWPMPALLDAGCFAHTLPRQTLGPHWSALEHDPPSGTWHTPALQSFGVTQPRFD